MKLPFPSWTLNANAKIYTIEIDKYGEETMTEFFNGRVNHVQKTKQILNAERQLITLSGWVVIPGDIYLPSTNPSVPLYIVGDGLEKRVYSTNKPSNPDGSVFSTELFFE